jgi:hypothetical protein
MPGKKQDVPYNPSALKEIWKEYGIKQPDFLIPHLGSITNKEFERVKREEFDKKVAYRDVFYDNHLGFMGTIMLIRHLEPRHVFVSEFGEELKEILPELIETLKNSLPELKCCQPESFLPMDLVFLCDLEKETIYSLIDEKFIPLSGSLFGKLNHPDLFHYYNEDCSKIYPITSDKFLSGRLASLSGYLMNENGLFFRT